MAAASTDEPVYYRIDRSYDDGYTITDSFRVIIPKDKIHDYMDSLFEKLVERNPPSVCPLGVTSEEHLKDKDAHRDLHREHNKKTGDYSTDCDPSPQVVRSADGLEITVSDEDVYKAVPIRMMTESDLTDLDINRVGEIF
uniref:Uncharacterized protein n=1 Tax=viral metagenome TaxID=1070528 RepID=A0A6C0JY62_9ZZZZ